MNRIIKFRGKRLKRQKGTWVYGNLCQCCAGTFIGNVSPGFEVDPSTIGQFVGLRDRTSKEIYEGDILNNYDNPNPLAVKWDSGAARFALYTPEGDFECGFDALEILFGGVVDAEIVGNIYENTRHS